MIVFSFMYLKNAQRMAIVIYYGRMGTIWAPQASAISLNCSRCGGIVFMALELQDVQLILGSANTDIRFTDASSRRPKRQLLCWNGHNWSKLIVKFWNKLRNGKRTNCQFTEFSLLEYQSYNYNTWNAVNSISTKYFRAIVYNSHNKQWPF